METRFDYFIMTISILCLILLGCATTDPSAEATQIQQTIDAGVNIRFTQTAEAQNLVNATRTETRREQLYITETAAFEATSNAAFNTAVAATAQANVGIPPTPIGNWTTITSNTLSDLEIGYGFPFECMERFSF